MSHFNNLHQFVANLPLDPDKRSKKVQIFQNQLGLGGHGSKRKLFAKHCFLKDNKGRTLLHIAAKKNFRDVAEFILKQVEIVEENSRDRKSSANITETAQALDNELGGSDNVVFEGNLPRNKYLKRTSSIIEVIEENAVSETIDLLEIEANDHLIPLHVAAAYLTSTRWFCKNVVKTVKNG